MKPYCLDYLNRIRFTTEQVTVGDVTIGGGAPIRVQSMTTTDTMNTLGSVEQSIRMIEAGCEIVRLTAPSKRDAENLAIIKKELVDRGYSTPLVADIHFTPNAAEIAADHVEKVRVNPGNYADKKKFEELIYTDDSYDEELVRIEEKFTPLVLKCKENGVAMRIGTNHGSLSDRILSRYGDTPKGMVESAMEFIHVCVKHDFHNIVLSMKASNTLVMVQAYRLLVSEMREQKMAFPLHLGVTEAGEGEDGRIKSAVGIGALMEDGLGDTIRVSLTEDPEFEIPVAQQLIEKYTSDKREEFTLDSYTGVLPYDPFDYARRETLVVGNIGGGHVPVVFGDLSNLKTIKPSHFYGFGYTYSVPLDKWAIGDAAADYIYIGSQDVPFELPGTLRIVCDFLRWKNAGLKAQGYIPLVNESQLAELGVEQKAFIIHDAANEDVSYLKNYQNLVIILETDYSNKTQLFRRVRLKLAELYIQNPIILSSKQSNTNPEKFQLWSSSDVGSLLIDGFGDGVWLKGKVPSQLINSTSFGVLQATRTRISKTEYISCPSCGRTLFDLQETTAKIRAKTSHLKGLKIGIMGCIVNGPGEMADADYGYVGTGPGKIHLYKEKVIVRKNIPEKDAVDALIDLIREHGDWVELDAD